MGPSVNNRQQGVSIPAAGLTLVEQTQGIGGFKFEVQQC